MPKKPPPNSFYFYMKDYHDREWKRGNRIPWDSVSSYASPSWKTMSKEQREPYEKRAKEAKTISKSNPKTHERYTSQGVAFSEIERQKEEAVKKKNDMVSRIKKLIDDGFMENTIADQMFYFMMGNYFCKTHENLYVPAEVAVTRFSLKSGICSRYHTYVNPVGLPLGSAFEAKDHSEKTHRLPPPPKAMGESLLYKIRADIVSFISQNNGFNNTKGNQNSLVIFTRAENIPMLESFIEQFHDEDSKIKIEIFSLQVLFYELKRKAQEMSVSGNVTIRSIFLSDMLLDRDLFENLDKLGCEWHDEVDASKFCALSVVVRWCFIFADNICSDLGIELKPGIHLPSRVDLSERNTYKDEPFPDEKPSTSQTNGHQLASQSYEPPPPPTGLQWGNASDDAGAVGGAGPSYVRAPPSVSEYTCDNNIPDDASDAAWSTAYSRKSSKPKSKVRPPKPGAFEDVYKERAQNSVPQSSVAQSSVAQSSVAQSSNAQRTIAKNSGRYNGSTKY